MDKDKSMYPSTIEGTTAPKTEGANSISAKKRNRLSAQDKGAKRDAVRGGPLVRTGNSGSLACFFPHQAAFTSP